MPEVNVPGKVICQSCGAEFDAGEPACPFCGSTYIPAAQRAYMRKLHGVKQEMASLGDLAERETKKEIGLAGRRAVRVVLTVLAIAAVLGVVFFIVNRNRMGDNRKEYRWREETLPKWEKLYEEGDYDGLVEVYYSAQDAKHDVWELPHAAFVRKYAMIRNAEELSSQTNEELGAYTLPELLAEYWDMYRITEDPQLTKEEKEILQPIAAPVMQEIRSRFPMSGEEEAAFMEDVKKHPSYVDYDLCKAYVEKHAEELGIDAHD